MDDGDGVKMYSHAVIRMGFHMFSSRVPPYFVLAFGLRGLTLEGF